MYFIYSIRHSYQHYISGINLCNVSVSVSVSVRMPFVMSVLARAKECRQYLNSLEKKNYFFSCCLLFFFLFTIFMANYLYIRCVCVCERVISQHFFYLPLFCCATFRSVWRSNSLFKKRKVNFLFLFFFFFGFTVKFSLGVIVGFPYNFCWFCCFGYFLLPVFSVLLCLFGYE